MDKGSRIFSRFYFFFPLIDLVAILIYLSRDFFGKVAEGSGVSGVMPVLSAEQIQFVLLGIVILEYSIIYFGIMRGVRKWHGTEHKVISAMENDDIDNVKTYSPIHERCGGTLVPTIIFANLLWLVIISYTGIMFGQMTFITLFIVANIKVFHKYDKFGIWFGKLFQKYISVKEPDKWQLDIGKGAVENLLKAEQGKDYIENKILLKY